MFFHYQEGSLVDHRAYKPYYTLVGPPALRLVLDPLAVIFLDNHLYIIKSGIDNTLKQFLIFFSIYNLLFSRTLIEPSE